MDIYFCDVCCARVTAGHLQRGNGVRNGDIIVCGSCIEQGHGAELLKIEVGAEEVLAAGAAPRLAGSDILNEPRDRAPTMKDDELDAVAADDHGSDGDDEATLDSQELEAVAEGDAGIEQGQEQEDEAADVADEEAVAEEADAELDSVDEDAFEDNAPVQSASAEAHDAPVVEDALEEAAAALDSNALDKEIESSASINVKDAEDDLDDSGSHPVQEPLDDADDDHTDSYSADELAAIKRLADQEDQEKDKEEAEPAADAKKTSGAGRKSSGRRKTTSSRRSTAQSGRKSTRSSTRSSTRKSTAKSGRTASKGTSRSSKASSKKGTSRSSRKTSSRSKAQSAMPMPLMISFITIPLLIVVFIVIALNTGSGPAKPERTYEANVTGLNMKIDHAYRFARSAYQSEDYDDLREAQTQIRDVMVFKNEVVEKMQAAGYNDHQMDKSLKKFRDLMQLERAVRDKIEEVKSRLGK